MMRLAISVEGPTEKEFFTRVMRPHLEHFEIDAIPTVITTKRVLDGPNHKGGDISVPRIIPQIKPLLRSFDFVTTFYDFYGFKGIKETDNVHNLSTAISEALNFPQNFIPYIQQYEFESLLFTDCAMIGRHFKSEHVTSELARAVAEKGNPEEVNDSRETCPSKRITAACKQHANRNYDKVLHGPVIAEKIGLEKIRMSCPLFGLWLTKIESLAKKQA